MDFQEDYPEYFAKFYDVIYHSIRDSVDLAYFRQKISTTKGAVLEIGCGTGRFFANALHQGADIYAVDISEHMLYQLLRKIPKEEAFRVKQQNVCDLKLDKKFELIIAPFRVFSHLLTVEEQLQALEKIANHLHPKGLFIFDLFVPNMNWIQQGMNNVVDFDGTYEKDLRLIRTTSMHSNLLEQINYVTMKFEWETTEGWMEGVWKFRMRYYFRYEIEHLIARSPLKLINIYGDYHENPIQSDSKEFLIHCCLK